MTKIKWLFRWEQAPSWKRLPFALLHAVMGGVVIGWVLSIVFGLVFLHQRLETLLQPVFWLSGGAAGAIFAVAFYITCGLPQSYLAPVMAEWPARRAQLVRVGLGAVGGVAGIVAAIHTVEWVLGVEVRTFGSMNGIMIVDGAAGAAIAALIGAGLQRDLRQKRLEVSLAQAQAKALQAQINPHFFFNTLNTIQALVDVDAKLAKQTIRQLANMFRYTLQCTEQPFVRLSEEMQFVSDYLEIEKARFGDRLRCELDAVTTDVEIPGLLLQPLAENAVKHGIGKRAEGGLLRIAIQAAGESVEIMVSNPVEGRVEEPVLKPGHALMNIMNRLATHYQGTASMTAAMEGELFVVRVRVPLRRI